MSQKKKFAGLDFDKTVWNSYSIWQNLDVLEAAGIVDKQLRADLQLITDWKNAKKDDQGSFYSYDMVCHDYGTIWAKTFKGVSKQEVEEVSEKMIDEKYDECLYSAIPELVNLLKENDYEVGFVSLAPIEIIRPVAKRLDIDLIMAFEMIALNGVYIGLTGSNIHHSGGKKVELEKLKEKGTYEWKDSIAFGDSPNDIGMLSIVNHGVILNPTDGIEEIANQRGWPIHNNDTIVDYVKSEFNLD